MPRRSLLVSLACALVCASGGLARATDPTGFDVIVVGSGTGGSAAAIQVARMGRSVALVDQTDGIGGQMIEAGVTSIDSFRFDFRPPSPIGVVDEGEFLSGIFGEFMSGVQAHYKNDPYGVRPTGTCYHSRDSACFEPHVGREVLSGMLGSIVRYPRTRVVVVNTATLGGRPTVTGVVVQNNVTGALKSLTAKVLIDASETSYVLALTPARYLAGNSTSDNPNENACVDSVTYLGVVRSYTTGETMPDNLRFDLAAPPPGGMSSYLNSLPGFLNTVSSSGSYCDPATVPPHTHCVWNWPTHAAYRGMPDSTNPDLYSAAAPPRTNWDRITRTGMNSANDEPFFVSDLRPQNEFAANCRAKLKTMQFLYYMQSDGQTDWSVANDEGYATPFNTSANNCPTIAQDPIEAQMPLMPYYRESLRLAGLHTLTAKEIYRVPYAPGKYRARTHFPSSVALGDYAVDLHGCVEQNTERNDLDFGDTLCDLPPQVPLPPDDYNPCFGVADSSCHKCRFGYFVGGPFQVPFESFVPETVDGLLAGDKNISVSRLAGGAVRLQPSTTAVGQAAGAIAALSARHGVASRAVPPVLVQDALLHVAPGSSGQKPASVSIYQYNDVPRSNAHWAGVQIVSAHEILVGNGVDTFSVNVPVDRAVAAVGTAGFAQLPLLPCTGTFFTDVPTTHYACKQIEAIARAGYTSGCGGGNYCPGNAHTRQEQAVFLVLAAQEQGVPYSSSPHFADVPKSHPFFKWIQLAYERGLMSGYQGTSLFAPTTAATRGEYADDLAGSLVSEGLRQVAP
jgi:hypothetical protein